MAQAQRPAANWRGRAGTALAGLVAGLVLVACASPPPDVPDPGLVYAPVPGSTLVTRREWPFTLAQALQAGTRTLVLAYQPAGQPPQPVAVLTLTATATQAQVVVQRLALPRGTPEGFDATVLEHLYALAMRQDPEARFCLQDGTGSCDMQRHGLAHADLLRRLAQARQAAVAAAGGSPARPWGVVSVAPAPPPGADDETFGVRLSSDGGPLAGATVVFSKAPHSGCVARTTPDGLAACRLVDQHGHEDAHEDHDKTPVVATFPGELRADRMLLPTTFVLPPRP